MVELGDLKFVLIFVSRDFELGLNPGMIGQEILSSDFDEIWYMVVKIFRSISLAFWQTVVQASKSEIVGNCEIR